MISTEGHLGHTDDDSKLHLVRVEEVQLVGGSDPFGVKSERIDTMLNLLSFFFMLSVSIARAKYVQRNREELVVDPSRVEGECSHHQ